MSTVAKAFDCTISTKGQRLIVDLPEMSTDLTFSYTQLFMFADAIGTTAMLLMDHPSDPGQDEAVADSLRIGRTGNKMVVVYFNRAVRQFNWTKNEAMIVAEKMAMMAETIAGEKSKAQ